MYEYVSWSKHQYLHDIYPAPEELKGIFDTLKISLSPGLLLCLHHRILNNMDNTKYYITTNPEQNKNDMIHSRIYKKDIEDDLQIKAEDLKQIGQDLCLTVHQIVQSKILRKKLLSDNLTSNLMVGGSTKDQIVVIPSATTEKVGSAANR